MNQESMLQLVDKVYTTNPKPNVHKVSQHKVQDKAVKVSFLVQMPQKCFHLDEALPVIHQLVLDATVENNTC